MWVNSNIRHESPRFPSALIAKGTTRSLLHTSCLAASRRASLTSNGNIGSRQSDAVCPSVTLIRRYLGEILVSMKNRWVCSQVHLCDGPMEWVEQYVRERV